jgi:putative oxidoreductase
MSVSGRFRVVVSHPLIGLVVRVYLGGVFVYASMYKINFPAEFAESIAAYQLVPYWALNPMALLMPWFELISGVLLVAGIRTRAAAAAAGGMLAAFSLAVLITLVRGIPVGCGCFSSLEDPLGWETLVRDLLWLGLAVQVFAYPSALQLEGRLFRSLQEARG